MALGFLLALGGGSSPRRSHEGHAAAWCQQGTEDRPGWSPDESDGAERCVPAMQHGMHAMHERMQTLHDHWKMMGAITDQKKLAEEMKKQMRMMDEMMEQMMQGDVAAAPTERAGEIPEPE
jgi:hypothetical protein